MSDLKSKLPDLKELGEITGKLFKDLKSSVTEIIQDYKGKREQEAAAEKKATAQEKPAAEKKAAPKKEDAPSADAESKDKK